MEKENQSNNIVQPTKNTTKLYVVIIILVITIFGLVGYVMLLLKREPQINPEPITNDTAQLPPTQELQPTAPDAMASWKTLVNENGFTVKYPPSLKIFADGMNVDETNAPDILLSSNPASADDESPFLHINATEKALTVYKNMTLVEISQLNYDANLTNANVFDKVITPYAASTLTNKPAFTYTLETKAYSGKWLGFPAGGSIDNVERVTIIETESQGKYFIIVYSTNDPVITSVLATLKFN